MRKRHLDSIQYDPISVSRLEDKFVPLHGRVKPEQSPWNKSVRITGDLPGDLNNIRFRQWLREQNGTPFSRNEGISGFEKIMNVKRKKEEPVHFPVCGFPDERADTLAVYNRGGITYFSYIYFVGGVPQTGPGVAVESLEMENLADHVFCHSKRFMHNIEMKNGTTVSRELYLVAMSLKLPNPINFAGWTAFVEANLTYPLITNTASTQLLATVDLLKKLDRVNKLVNSQHPYFPDGALDGWVIMTERQSGDCEDFALTKADFLINRMKFPPSAVHLMTGKTEAGLGHAWLVVQTTMGDYALDINHNDIVCNRRLPYTHQQRQTGTHFKMESLLDNFIGATHAGYSFTRFQPKVWWYIYDPLINKFSEIFGQVQDLPYTRDIRAEADAVMGVVEWAQPMYPLLGGIGRDTLNACNFSADNNTIYVSQLYGTWPAAYAFNYKEVYSGGIFGPNQIIARYYAGIWFIDRNGDVVERAIASGSHASVKNIHTGLEVQPLSFVDGIQIAAPNGYFSSRLYQHTEPTIYTGIADTRPINGSWVTSLTPGEPPDWQATLHGVSYETLRGLFPENFTDAAFRMKYIYATLSKSEGAFSGMYSWSISHTLLSPWPESETDCGAIGGSTSVFPEQARKRVFPLVYGQGRADKLVGPLLTYPMTHGSPIVELSKSVYYNGVSVEDQIAAVLGVGVGSILGLIYLPKEEA